MERRDVLDGFVRIARIVQPRIGRVRSRMAFEIEDFHSPLPYRLALKFLMNSNALTVDSLHTVKIHNPISECIDMFIPHAPSNLLLPMCWMRYLPQLRVLLIRNVAIVAAPVPSSNAALELCQVFRVASQDK